jgi:hypothetical protein
MWREARRGYPKPIGDTRIPSDMGLRFYFSSSLKIKMGMGIPELFGFGENKIRPDSPRCHAYSSTIINNTLKKINNIIYPQ